MSWKDIIKARRVIPNKKIRKEIDNFVNNSEDKVTVREVNQHLLKKLGIVAYTYETKIIQSMTVKYSSLGNSESITKL